MRLRDLVLACALTGCAASAVPAPRASVDPRPLEALVAELAPHEHEASGVEADPLDPDDAPTPARPVEPRPHPAPPLFGGTLLVTPDGYAVTSDPERDRIWVARFDPPAIVREVALEPLDEPGVLARSDDGTLHVVLRRGGALLSFRPDDDEPPTRRSVCPSPRGVAARGVELVVGCAGGELVRLPSRGAGMDVRRVGPDLRDVGFEADGTVWATRFRSAHLVRWIGDEAREAEIPTITRAAGVYASAPFGAGVAWRTIAMSDGSQVMLHQRERKAPLPAVTEYYGEVGGALMGAVTAWEDGVPVAGALLPAVQSVLPIDAAPLADGWLALVLGGDGGVDLVHPATGSTAPGPLAGHPGRAVAIVAHEAGLVVQYQDPPSVVRFDRPDEVGGVYVALGAELEPDRGQQLFHTATAHGVACASCHPEGLDDGHTWQIPEVGPRRTQALTGGVLSTGPYHWSGELPSFGALMTWVFESRMGGEPLSPEDVAAVGRWLDALPDPPPPSGLDPEAVERGRALFEDGRAQCARCHAGPRGTDGRAHDVGTGGRFQTPALSGLALRAPYLHDGCALTIEERFGRCHTRGYGRVDHLDDAQRADLIAYLASR